MRQYRQPTSEERFILSHLRKQGCNQSEIARQLGRHRSTISREIARNRCKHIDGHYRPSKAHRRTVARRRRSRRNRQFSDIDLIIVWSLLGKLYSPEKISGYLKRTKRLNISYETIYRYIWHDKRQGGDLWIHLRCANKRRRKRYSAYDSRGRLAVKRHISERPGSVEKRQHKGHWEIDTVMGKGPNACIVTLVERKTGFTLIGKLPNRTTAALNQRANSLMMRYPQKFKTITADNGTEFHQYKEIEKVTGARFYFATPHHSWERGTNENTNGLIRQYLPKGMSIAAVTQAECDKIAWALNSRPRKRLAYRTPAECFLNA